MTKQLVKDIWIEAETWADGEWTPADDNTDVIVTHASGKKWIASFFTYRNILSLSEKNKATGECLGGAYFWATDMILIDEVTRPRIESVVLDLLERGDFESTFSPIDGNT